MGTASLAIICSCQMVYAPAAGATAVVISLRPELYCRVSEWRKSREQRLIGSGDAQLRGRELLPTLCGLPAPLCAPKFESDYLKIYSY